MQLRFPNTSQAPPSLPRDPPLKRIGEALRNGPYYIRCLPHNVMTVGAEARGSLRHRGAFDVWALRTLQVTYKYTSQILYGKTVLRAAVKVRQRA